MVLRDIYYHARFWDMGIVPTACTPGAGVCRPVPSNKHEHSLVHNYDQFYIRTRENCAECDSRVIECLRNLDVLLS